MNSLESRLGHALADRYRIERELGAGGMATVYLAEDLRHDRKVAIKVLKPELAAVLGAERFVVEIKTTAALSHPHILPLFDSGTADGFLFYVMPYIKGETIREKLNRETQFGVDEAVRIAREVADALDYAHRSGVIHRDIKPENILLHDGRAMVMDFGIALAVSAAAGGRMTETGLSLGTPHYMSPEQATADKELTGRSDIYSLASVLYEALSGEPPHTGGSAQQVIMKIIVEPVPPVTALRKSVPPNVSAALAKALEKLPADRFDSAKAFSDALGNAAFAPESVTARSTAPVSAVPRRTWAIAALAATCVALGALAVRGWTRKPPPVQAVEFELALPDSFDIISTGAASSLALSRDGQSIVFIARTPGTGYQVYERRLDDRTIRVIDGTTTARSPVLNPDATEVLFSPTSDNDPRAPLSRISTRGGTPRSVAQSVANNGQYSWGDGNQIVFSDRDTLWIVSADGGPRALLVAPDSARRHLAYGFPDILPDGNAALISIWRGAGSLDSIGMGVVTIPDGKVTELGTYGIYARYSTTGHIVYGTTGGTLLAVPFDARSRRVTGSPTVIAEDVRGGSGGAIPMTVSRNGTLAFIPSSRVALGAVIPVIVDRTGRERPLSLRRGWYRSPRVSPDGQQVALVIGTGASGGNVAEPDIWRLDVGSADLQRVTTDRSSDRPLWSRDGLQILSRSYRWIRCSGRFRCLLAPNLRRSSARPAMCWPRMSARTTLTSP